MATCAQQVCAAVRERLLGNVGTGQRVYTDRVWPVAAEALPDCLVFAGRELVKGASVNYPRVQEHQLEVFVVFRARAVEGLDAALDAGLEAICGQLFDTLAHKTLGGLLKAGLDEVARDRVLPEPDDITPQRADASVGKAVMTLLAKYHTRENAPATFC